ncbi:hypothetical protein C8F01DRAFT_986435 [Mycena amicta]|nr:hypothetical protein C8F01DRAFT_986435 [Mycena amicta]
MAIEVDPEALWEDFRDSPTSRLLGPSPIVQSAIARNMYLFQPPTRVASVQQNHKPFDRMLAVHIRRGDYVQHCHNLAAYGASYYSWAQLPELVDKFTPGQPEEEMMRHCLPTPAQLVQRIEHVRSEYGKVLDVLYLLTNSADEDGAWLDEVKRSLRGWHTLVTTRELILDAEQTEVGMAVDMQLAREAAVFLGNGWSSFTSNIIHQRLVDGRVPLATRLT